MSEPRDIPYILYLDFPDGEDNHLRKLAGIRRYALTRDWPMFHYLQNAGIPAPQDRRRR